MWDSDPRFNPWQGHLSLKIWQAYHSENFEFITLLIPRHREKNEILLFPYPSMLYSGTGREKKRDLAFSLPLYVI